jgi:hypothetical protein
MRAFPARGAPRVVAHRAARAAPFERPDLLGVAGPLFVAAATDFAVLIVALLAMRAQPVHAAVFR